MKSEIKEKILQVLCISYEEKIRLLLQKIQEIPLPITESRDIYFLCEIIEDVLSKSHTEIIEILKEESQ